MNAMLLAAGRGERLGALTDERPKPLLEVGGCRLIEHHLFALARAGIVRIVINTAYRGEQIRRALGDGERYGVRIRYSDEGTALETGGGIVRALPLLGDAPFLVVNSDVYTDYDFSQLPALEAAQAVLVLVANPAHHPRGDFALRSDRVQPEGHPRFTYSGIGVFDPKLFRDAPSGCFALGPVLLEAAGRGELRGVVFPGDWIDVGTPERLQIARRRAAGRPG